ncbi:MAG: alanine--tRNA ligase, partial [Acidiphilium sp. 21-66-27]
MTSSNDIRATFLDFFARNGHEVVPSAPLVPRNDPTLMFVNAGMVPFKNVFTGHEHRPYVRAASSQKCVRAGGKHNDLDNVGYTARHHTFFEMLGNFSFGDYFKDVAIENAWTLLTKDFGIPKDKLLVTVYHEDDEAASLWKRIAGLPDEKIIRIATDDNFWRMGDTGPCGPCSEIFYDHGPAIPGGPPGSPDEDGDRFIEIWNLVAEVSHTDPDGAHKVSHRVIADHLRATSFLIADGVLPSNEGRGYVLRRIMRRAMRHAHRLGMREPFIYRLVPVLTRQMGVAFPELPRAEALIVETLKLEEQKFAVMLERGLSLLEDEVQKLGSGEKLPGAVAFKLYDTYGFPLDLTEDALREQHRGLDHEGFTASMSEQKARARAAWAGSGDAATETVWLDLRDRLGGTEFL